MLYLMRRATLVPLMVAPVLTAVLADGSYATVRAAAQATAAVCAAAPSASASKRSAAGDSQSSAPLSHTQKACRP